VRYFPYIPATVKIFIWVKQNVGIIIFEYLLDDHIDTVEMGKEETARLGSSKMEGSTMEKTLISLDVWNY
jgi:hypothetical protein